MFGIHFNKEICLLAIVLAAFIAAYISRSVFIWFDFWMFTKGTWLENPDRIVVQIIL